MARSILHLECGHSHKKLSSGSRIVLRVRCAECNDGTKKAVVEEDIAKQRRNQQRHLRHETMIDLGMVRCRDGHYE